MGRSSPGPLWAPNSKEFALRGLDGSLAVVNASTGVVRTLMIPAPGASIFASGWSPRSDHLLVTENTSQVPTVPQFELLAVGVPDGHIHDLGPGAGGAYSPDGSTIAYFDSGNLKLLNLTTGTRKTLAPPYYPLQGALAWAPNGRTIAYSEGDTGFIPIVLHATPVNGSPGRVMGLLPGRSSRHPCGLAACSSGYPTGGRQTCKRHRRRKPNDRPHPRPPTTSGPERLSDLRRRPGQRPPRRNTHRLRRHLPVSPPE